MADGKPIAYMLQIQGRYEYWFFWPWFQIPRKESDWPNIADAPSALDFRCHCGQLLSPDGFPLLAKPDSVFLPPEFSSNPSYLNQLESACTQVQAHCARWTWGSYHLLGETFNLKTGVSPAFGPLEGSFWGIFYMPSPRVSSGTGNHSSNQFNNSSLVFLPSLSPSSLLSYSG